MPSMPLHDQVLDEIRRSLADVHDRTRALELTVTLLARRMPDYSWVGVYLLDGNELVLGPFVGAPSPHTRIPLGRGICGAAAAEKMTIVVDDVNADPRYLACSIETKSEIVVPILDHPAQPPPRGDKVDQAASGLPRSPDASTADANVLGEIDVDSHRLAAFGDDDRRMLEAIAVLLAARLTRRQAAGGVATLPQG